MNWQMDKCGICQYSKLLFSDKKMYCYMVQLRWTLKTLWKWQKPGHIFHLFEASRTGKFIETYLVVGRGWEEGGMGIDYLMGV